MAAESYNTLTKKPKPRYKFPKGNSLGNGGNPHANTIHKLRGALYRSVTTEDVEKVGKNLLKLALNGDLDAIRELLDRLLGKSTQPVEIAGAVRISHELVTSRAVMADPDAVRLADSLYDRLANVAGEFSAQADELSAEPSAVDEGAAPPPAVIEARGRGEWKMPASGGGDAASAREERADQPVGAGLVPRELATPQDNPGEL